MKTVVVLHGFSARRPEHSLPLLNYFSENKYRVIVPDLLSGKYPFSAAGILKNAEAELQGQKPDIIAGISLGGLLAPYLANAYPEAKLILVGTGPYFKTKIPAYNQLIQLENHDRHLIIVRLAKLTPRRLYRLFYRLFNKYSRGLAPAEYKQRADESWENVATVPLSKIKEVIQFVAQTDNTKLLPGLINKTIIFAGTSDSLMPLGLSKIMNALIKSSRLVVSERLHYDIFTKADCCHLDDFLNQNG